MTNTSGYPLQAEWLYQEYLEDGRELLTIQMMLAPNLSGEEREDTIKLGVAVAIDALNDDVGDAIDL